jgi:hypothetical protein
MACRPTTGEKAPDQFKRFAAYKSHHDPSLPTAKRNLLASDASKLVASFLKGTTTAAKLYRCHWDNNDDTTSEALVSIDGGEVRVVVGWEGG